MSEQKLISVVIPVYNAGDYLEDNLNTLLDQTYSNIEVVMVDDGSTDDSELIAKQFCEKDKRFSYYKQANQGAPAARNHGFSKSNGEYVIFVDSDDWLKADALSLLYFTAQKAKADLVIGQYDTVDEKGNMLESKKMEYTRDAVYNVKDSLSTLFFLSPMPGNKLYNAELLRKHELVFSNLKRAQDLNFYLKFLSFAQIVCTISDTTYLYRIRSNSISHTVSPIILETITSIEDVEAFYKCNHKYMPELFNTLKLKYYSDQLAKIPQITNKRDRAQTYERLVTELKPIKKNNMLKNRFESKYEKVQMKMRLPFLYKSQIYSYMQTFLIKQKDRRNRKMHE